MKTSLLIVAAFAMFLTAAKAEDQIIRSASTVTIAGERYTLPRFGAKSGQAGKVSYPVTDPASKKDQDAVIESKASLAGNTLNYEITASIPTAAGVFTKVSASGSSDGRNPISYSFMSDGKVYGFSVVFSPLAVGETL